VELPPYNRLQADAVIALRFSSTPVARAAEPGRLCDYKQKT